MGVVTGGAQCLISLGNSADEAIKAGRGAALDVSDALAANKQRITRAYLEEWRDATPDRLGFWRRIRGVGLSLELQLLLPEATNS